MKLLHLANAIAMASLLSGCIESAGEDDLNTNNTPKVESKEPTSTTITGQISGLLEPQSAQITASGNGELHTVKIDDQGNYEFEDLTPGVNYALKVQAMGYQQTLQTAQTGSNTDISVEELAALNESNIFTYTWQDDEQSVSGLEYASAVNEQIKVEIEGAETEIPNIAAAQLLYRDYGITLDDGGDLAWTQAHAYRLLETLRQIPQEHCSETPSALGLPCDTERHNIPESVWQLSSAPINNDVAVDGKQVKLDAQAFTYADPVIATVDGQRGRYYSKRLHHAAVNFITNGGKDLKAANRILETRYGVTIDTRGNGSSDRYFRNNYNKAVIAEDRNNNSWQSFTPEEVLMIINQFEELPLGLHVIRQRGDDSKGLKYLFRRANGHNHPLYPEAPAVAWPGAGYIEFMEKAFKGDNLEHMQRLVLHEKTHFLWHYVLTTEMKREWLKLSDWYRVDGAEDMHLNDQPYSTNPAEGETHTHGSAPDVELTAAQVNSSDGWSARKTTNFVSAYAQLKNPNEDLAESVSYFLINPDKLRSRAPAKYEFIRDRLMAGIVYLQKIRDDLTFEVLNLHPDYVYPGKIKRVDIDVKGAANEQKRVTVNLELYTTENCTADSNDSCLENATGAYTRIFSSIETFVDLGFYPVNENGHRVSASNRLRGTFTLPETAKNGWWTTAQIKVTDAVGNERYQRSTDYGWQLYVNNPSEDLVAPEYVANSMKLDLSEPRAVRVSNGEIQSNLSRSDCDGYTGSGTCEMVRTMTAKWDVDEDIAMSNSGPCFVRFASNAYNDYSDDRYGSFKAQLNGVVDGECTVKQTVSKYYRAGQYRVGHLSMEDRALNKKGYNFADNHHSLEASPKVTLPAEGLDQDLEQPEMNIDRCDGTDKMCISVQAEPTNPANPNGETNVEITFWARDNKSGLGTVSYRLRDPQGKSFFNYFYHANTHTDFFKGDPMAWQKYTVRTTLPVGSAPGTWGVSSFSLHDKAGNRQFYDFTETTIFEPTFELQVE